MHLLIQVNLSGFQSGVNVLDQSVLLYLTKLLAMQSQNVLRFRLH